LTLSGSLLGESIASAVVIGALVVMNLREVGMTKEQVCATIVMGCAMGSIMPPISQASTMAAGLVGLEGAAADAVLNWTYLTIGITFVLVCLFTTTFFVKIKQLPEDLIPDKKAGQIIKENWTSLVPLCFLALVVIFRSGFHLDLLVLFKPIFDPISKIPIVKGLGYNITQILYLTIILSLFYKPVRSDFGGIVKEALGHVWPTVKIQLCAAFMIGAFYVGGQIDKTSAYLATLSPGTLIVGGLLAMCLIGMLTGSQTTVQSTIFIMLGPALIQTGISPVSAAIAGGHWAMAGQGMPPADTVTFATAGLIDGIDESGEKVNLLQSMLYSCFMCACMIIAGLIFVLVIR
ncbi:MAG: TRAP transporter large permease subunit, partial [Lachnospiraceae bacterium]|nr:TRAP transporter large permease subunit [Lachnospiraceae bacterium]